MSVGRGDVHNAATVLARHRAYFVLHAQEHPEDVRVVNGLEVLGSGVLDGAELAFEAGVVHGNVKPTELCDRCVDEVADFVFLRDIGLYELCLRAERSQFLDEFFAFVMVAAGHDHLGTFSGECHGGGTADPSEGTGDENNLLGHRFPSTMSRSVE